MLTNPHVFDDGFVPQDIVHRNQELNLLETALKPLVDGAAGTNAFCFGDTGVGKTCCARYIAGELKRRADATVQTTYVNCWEISRAWGLLDHILDTVAPDVTRSRSATPLDELCATLGEHVATDQPLVVICDEVDRLQEPDVLYALHDVSGVALIMIANDEEQLFARLDDRLDSRLKSGIRVGFDRYGVETLTEILAGRARAGLVDGAVERAVLEQIADQAAGDARVAITSLRVAAERAMREAAGTIEPRHVEEAVPVAKADIRQKTIDQLSDAERELYELIADAEDGTLRASELHERYEATVVEPRSRRQRRNYLEKMVRYNLIKEHGQTRWTTYEVVEVPNYS